MKNPDYCGFEGYEHLTSIFRRSCFPDNRFQSSHPLKSEAIVVTLSQQLLMERKYSDLLLRGNQPVILCSVKGLNRMKLGKSARTDMKENRLVDLSAFNQTIRRTMVTNAIVRNNLVSAMSVAMLIPHATTGGKIWQTVRQSIETGHPVFTFDDEANTSLKDMGAKAYTIDIACEQIFQCLDRIKTPDENNGQIK